MHSIRFFLSLSFILPILFSGEVVGQSCIELLDSVNYFSSKHPEKSRYYADRLGEALDQGKCNQEIGIEGIYNNLGLLYWSFGDQRKALAAFKGAEAFVIRSSDSSSSKLLDIYYNLSTLLQEMGDYPAAREYLLRAEDVVHQNQNPGETALIRQLYREGIFFRETGDFRKSISALENAQQMAGTSAITDSARIAILIEIGTTYRHFGDLKLGETKLLDAVGLAESTGSKMMYLTAIDRLSSLKIEEGEYSDSESYLLHNLEIKEEEFPENDFLQLESLNSLGVLYYKLNDLRSAEKYIDQALDITSDYANLQPYMLNNLGTIYMQQGEAEKAFDFFKKAAEGFKQLYGSMHPDYASCLNNLAGAEKNQGNYEEALNLYMRVLDMDKVIYGREHQRYATSLSNIALLYMQLGNLSLAGKFLQEVKVVRKKSLSENHPSYVKTLNDLGLYYLLIKDSTSALESFDEALYSEIHHMKDVFSVLTDNQRKLYFKKAKSNIERFCGIAFSGKYIETKWAEKALNYFINTKGILFYASDKLRKLVQLSEDPVIQQVYNTWRDKKYKLAQSYLLSEEDRQKLNTSIVALENECSDLEKKLALRFKAFADQEQSQFYTWEDISSVLDLREAALDIVAFRNYTASLDSGGIKQGFEDQFRYAAFVIKPDSILHRITFRDDVDLIKAYSRYTNSLKFNLPDKTSYDAFWRPIDKRLSEVSKLYFSPDGIYFKMNPVVYHDHYTDQYVADKYDLVNITSSKDLLLSQDRIFNRNAKIFGNPDFGKVTTEYDLVPLPGAEREAKDISDILQVRKWETSSYYYRDATEDVVKNLANPGVVHIATHGYFKEDPNLQDPLQSSGLFLTTNQASDNDGILSAYEAMNLVLDKTNLVVLAACETGLGTIQNGEGVFGLQRSFLVAGAQNILISLVKINDEAARRFMNLFYQQLLDTEDPQSAFFAARRLFKNEDPNPYNWGAYVLVSK